MQREVKFNGGKGAILCNFCKVIVKEYLTKEEIEDKTPVICSRCHKKKNYQGEAKLYNHPDEIYLVPPTD